MNAADLLAAARQLLSQPAGTTTGIWPRATALLTRQALENALDEFWEASPATAGLSRCSRRAQFACLPTYLKGDVARGAAYVWGALSRACHYHAYELAPTAAELTGWISNVAGFMAACREAAGPAENRGNDE
jgi:hypothetical protein